MATTVESSRRAADHRRATGIAVAILVVLAATFLLLSWPRQTAPFADSDDGINGAVWGYDSRSLRELGIVESRLGGRRLDGTRYATHPPLIVVETAIAESLAGEHPWTTRAPAWIGSLASLGLLFVLLRRNGTAPLVAAGAVVAGCGTNMLLAYGGMLDTPVTALPFGLAVLVVWLPQWRAGEPDDRRSGDPLAGRTTTDTTDTTDTDTDTDTTGTTDTVAGDEDRRPAAATDRPWIAAGVTSLLAGLAGWQAAFLVGLCALALLLRARRRGVATVLADAAPYLIGVAAGLALSVGWSAWAHDGIGVLRDKFTRRSGESASTSVADMVSFQIPWLAQLFGLALVGWIGALVALRDRRWRPLAAISLVTVVAYAVLFREAAGGHQYWNFWGLLVATVGFGYLFDLLARRIVRDGLAGTVGAGLAVVALGAVLAIVDLTVPQRTAVELIDRGQGALTAISTADLPADQDRVPYVGEAYRPDAWLTYNGLPPGLPLEDAAALRTLAADHPNWQVLVLGACPDPDPSRICVPVTGTADGTAAFVLAARDAAGRLGS